MDRIGVKACAKLNLFLDITGKRGDGYHELKSVMQSVDLMDYVRVSKADKISVGCDTPSLCGKGNTAYKAAAEFFRRTGIDSGAEIFIEKHIPTEAGLAGGSADAAAVIFALDRLFETALSEDILCEIGKSCGADVPFSIFGGTKLCEGIGERLSPVPEIQDCFFVIVKPEFGMSTVESYRIFDLLNLSTGEHGGLSKAVSALEQRDISALAGSFYNALECSATSDETGKIKAALLEQGALGSLMTGSGSAVFGVFSDIETAVKAKNALSEKYRSVFLQRPSSFGCAEDNSFAVYNRLAELDIPYERVDHFAMYTMEEMSTLGVFDRGIVGKNLFLRDAKGKRHFLVFVYGDKHVDLASLEEKIGVKHCSFASAERLMKYLGLTKGSVSPLGVINDKNAEVEFIIDSDFMGCKSLGVHPNQNTTTLFLSFESLKKVIEANGNSIQYIKI